jgi:CheY-like chemotaxis protein
MPQGGTLSIQTCSVWHGQDSSRAGLVPGRYVRLSVEDTGCGIAPEVQAQVFEPFFTTKVDGSGLGLPAVGGAVRQAGGEVWVHSAPGKGARFDVDLPAAQAAENRSPAAHRVSGRSVMGGTILLVDDDAAFRTLVARMLEGCGYRVLQAEGPQDAVAHCASGVRIDLLVSDICMPGASGPDLARRVRERSPGVPVLFTSGLDRASLEAVGELPRAGFLEKPFRKNSLLASVRSLLESGVGPDRAGGAL